MDLFETEILHAENISEKWEIAAVKLHALDDVELCRHVLGLLDHCPYRLLGPGQGIVQTAEVRDEFDPSTSLDLPREWAIFAQRQVRSGAVVVVGISSEVSRPVIGLWLIEMLVSLK